MVIEDDLEKGKSYSVRELLMFLESNYQRNIHLASSSISDLLNLPSNREFVVTDIRSIFLHNFALNSKTHNIGYNMTNEYRLYYIEPK